MWPPGQVAEAILGYDVAANLPRSSPLWAVLRASPRTGVTMSPSFWAKSPDQPPDVSVPSSSVSLILQFKRPEYLTVPWAKQWGYWRQEYYRVRLDTPEGQLETLCRLEQRLGRMALVRYAAPVIPSWNELQRLQRNRQVLRKSNFVGPRRVQAHEVWTYARPGNRGFANPEGEEVAQESIEEFVSTLADSRGTDHSILSHLRHVAEALGVEEPEERAMSEDAIPVEISPDRVQGLSDLLLVGERIGSLGASWWIAARA